MPATRVGAEMDLTAQTVELLLEQWSIPSSELFDITACVLRKERMLKSLVTRSKALVESFDCRSTGLKEITICSEIEPSFLSSLRGSLVKRSLSLGSRLCNCDAPPGPAPGLPPCGMRKMSLSGYGPLPAWSARRFASADSINAFMRFDWAA